MGQQLTVHQDDVQASAHIVFHRTHDPKGKEEKQNTTIGPECGVSTMCSRLWNSERAHTVQCRSVREYTESCGPSAFFWR